MHDAQQVDVDGAAPVPGVVLVDRTVEQDAGVVDHAVQAPVLGDDPVDERLHVGGVGDVEGVGARPGAEGRGSRTRGVRVEVGDGDVAAPLDQGSSDREPDAGGSPGDDGAFGREGAAVHGYSETSATWAPNAPSAASASTVMPTPWAPPPREMRRPTMPASAITGHAVVEPKGVIVPRS